MPQASQEVLDAWPHGDSEALKLLRQNFRNDAGVFKAKKNGYRPTEEEAAAIDYLVQEWDYGYELA